jgi:hypothetical protein
MVREPPFHRLWYTHNLKTCSYHLERWFKRPSSRVIPAGKHVMCAIGIVLPVLRICTLTLRLFVLVPLTLVHILRVSK